MVARMCLVPDRRIESRFHDSAWSRNDVCGEPQPEQFTINEFLAADLHARDTLSTEAHYEDPRSVRPARPARSPSCLVALMLRALPRDTAPGARADEGRARATSWQRRAFGRVCSLAPMPSPECLQDCGGI